MAEEAERRPAEPRSFDEVEVISPDRRRPRQDHRRQDAAAGEVMRQSPDGAGVKP